MAAAAGGSDARWGDRQSYSLPVGLDAREDMKGGWSSRTGHNGLGLNTERFLLNRDSPVRLQLRGSGGLLAVVLEDGKFASAAMYLIDLAMPGPPRIGSGRVRPMLRWKIGRRSREQEEQALATFASRSSVLGMTGVERYSYN